VIVIATGKIINTHKPLIYKLISTHSIEGVAQVGVAIIRVWFLYL